MLRDLKSFHSPVRLEHGEKKGVESTAVWCHQRPEPSIQEWGSWILIYLSSQSPTPHWRSRPIAASPRTQRSQKIGLVFPLLIFKAWCLFLQGLREGADQDKSFFLLAPLTSVQQPGFSLLPDAQKRWAVTSDNSLSLSGAQFPPL